MEKKKTVSKGIIFLITALFFAAQFIDNYGDFQMAAIPGRIFEAFHLNDMQFSSLITAPMVPSIFLSIVIGMLVDRFGFPKIVGIWLIIAALGYTLRCFVTDYTGMLVAMALSGFSCMVVNANLSKFASSLYPMEKVGLVVGIIMAAANAATALSFPTTALIPSLQVIFWIPTVASIVCAVLWILFARERLFQNSHAPAEEKVSVRESLLLCLKNRSLWLAGLTQFLLLGASMVITNFHVAALTTLHGYSETGAGSFNSVLMIGSILGSIFLPIYVTKKPERAPVVVFLMLAVSALSCYGMVMLPTWGIYVCAFLNGALRSGVIATMLTIPVLLKEIGPRNAGTAGGLIITMQLLGGVVVPTYIIVPLGAGDYNRYFLIASIFMFLSGVVAFTLMKTCGAFGKRKS